MKGLAVSALAMMIITVYGLSEKAVIPDEAESLILGKYMLTTDPASPDYKEYLQEMMVPEHLQVILEKMKPNLEITKSGDKYMYKIETPLMSREVMFDLGESVDSEYIDGRKYTAVFTLEGQDTILQEMKFDDGSHAFNKFVFTPEDLTSYLMVNNTTAVRMYKRVNEFSD